MKLKNITFKMSDEELDFIETMAKDIHACPKRNRNRGYAQVYNSVKAGVILELALKRQGATKNPSKFDEKDRSTYAWDVMWNGKRTEVKRMKFLSKPDVRWYSWDKPENVSTFLKNIDYVEQLIVGDYETINNVDNTYSVSWMLITKVEKDFKKFIKKSMYNEGQMYYNHKSDKNCTYLI